MQGLEIFDVNASAYDALLHIQCACITSCITGLFCIPSFQYIEYQNKNTCRIAGTIVNKRMFLNTVK